MTPALPPRTLLAVPAASARFVDSGLRSGADALMLDLEDGVRESDRPTGRDQVLATATSRTDDPGPALWVRVNAAGTADHDADLSLLDRLPLGAIAGVVLAKATANAVAQVAARTRHPLIPLVESARGVEDAAATAGLDGVIGLLFGQLDHVADVAASGGLHVSDLAWARSRVVNGAAASGRFALAGPSTATKDPDAVLAEARSDAACGFAGKLCIHPSQLEPVDRAFRPTTAQVDHARRVVDAAEAARGGAFALDGRMVDAPVVARARAVLAAAAPLAQRSGDDRG